MTRQDVQVDVTLRLGWDAGNASLRLRLLAHEGANVTSLFLHRSLGHLQPYRPRAHLFEWFPE